MIGTGLSLIFAIVSHAEPLYYCQRDEAGLYHYRVVRVRTPAWDRDAPVPESPRIVRRILRCRELVLDQSQDELRFTTDEDLSERLSSRIDLVARGTGLIPYFEELRRRAHERSYSSTGPATNEPAFTTSIAGRRPVLLSHRVDEEGSVRLRFHVGVEALFPTASPTNPAGEIREFALRWDGTEFEWREEHRAPFDASKPPPRHIVPSAIVAGEAVGGTARLDRLTHHCLANDRYALRWLRGSSVIALDSSSLYGNVRLLRVHLAPGSLWIATREDRDEGAAIVWLDP